MGVALWFLSGVAAFGAARAIPAGRLPGYASEGVAAAGAAMIAGVAATALDFGGWNELDWRALAFTLLCAFAAAGCVRVVRLARRSLA